MASSPPGPKRVPVGAFAFDAERRLLVGGERALSLPAKEFEFLSLLVSRRPAAVSKEEIQNALWPRTIVAETSLTTLVSELRAKLGQAGREGPIRTVHGFGYALEAEGTDTADAPAPRLVRGTTEIRLSTAQLVLGREPGLPGTIDNGSVSRRHALLTRGEEGVVVTDLGSKNGTFVRGVRISQPVALADGDEVRFELVSFVFRAAHEAGESSTKTVV